jgi:putative polyhydroxyalkanoate system protein
MSYDIELVHKHQLSDSEVRQRAENFIATMQNEFALDWQWDGNTIHFAVKGGAAKGLTGEVRLDQGSVFVGAKLPFMLKFMKKLAEQQLATKLTQVLA